VRKVNDEQEKKEEEEEAVSALCFLDVKQGIML